LAQEEHEAREAPYIVMDPKRRGYGIRCRCGWRSALLDSEEECRKAFADHKANPPEPEQRSFVDRLFRRPQNRWPGWPEERRRD
jgi:hypothetical protein